MAYYIGIDPGIHGAIAILDSQGRLMHVEDIPILSDGAKSRSTINAPLLVDLIRKTYAVEAYVELVGVRPGEGAVGAFAFGRCRGVIEGALAGCGIPMTLIAPPTWKKICGIPAGKLGAKDAARSKAIGRWPDKAPDFKRVKDADRAEAALIAYAGLVRFGKLEKVSADDDF
jgi:hypothetical protein